MKNRIAFRYSCILYCFLPGLFTLSACKKLVSVDAPTDQLITATVFSSDESAVSAINGLYVQMIKGNTLFASNGMTLYPGMSSDELYNTFPGVNDQFSKNNLDPANTTVQNNLWSFGYSFIYQANAIIAGLQQSTAVSASLKNQLLGEAKCIHAFCHFYLVNLFGDVPLVVSTNYEVNASLPRVPATQVYDFITSELREAQSLLGSSYPGTGKGRINKYAATALLARVQLYTKQYAAAEASATAVINAGLYNMAGTILSNVFLANNDEAIWQLVPVSPNYNTWEGNAFIPSGTSRPVYALTTFLLNAFENGDLRKSSWTKTVTVSGVQYTYPYKYKIRTGTPVTEYYTVFRLAEQYLIRAEARANQDNLAGATNDINLIRERAGLPDLGISTKAQTLLAIEHERQVELFAEWGHRWFDLKRTGRVDAVLGAEKPLYWQPADAWYPIPLKEIQRNPLLTQNAGY